MATYIDWNLAYTKGTNQGAGDQEQIGRYLPIVGLISTQSKSPIILDVGCGSGILRTCLNSRANLSYTGIDISQVAIDKNVNKSQSDRFICTCAEKWIPDRTFNVIVLNEVLYYFSNPLNVLEKYLNALSKNGLIICSIFEKPAKPWEKNPNKLALQTARNRLGRMKSPGAMTLHIDRNRWSIIWATIP